MRFASPMSCSVCSGPLDQFWISGKKPLASGDTSAPPGYHDDRVMALAIGLDVLEATR